MAALDIATPVHRYVDVGGVRVFYREAGPSDAPTLLLVANWYLSHRYRTGADTSPALPFLLAAFAFSGDLVRSSP